MEQQEVKKVVLIVIAVGLAAMIIYNGWDLIGVAGISGVQAETAKLEVERKKLEQSVSTAKALVGDLPRIRKERETLEAQLKEVSKKLPGERESAEVLRSVESLAGKSGLTLTGVKRRAVRTQELYSEIPMDIGVGGSYQDLVRFADQLAQLDRLVTLSEVQIQRPPPPVPGQTAAAAVIAPPGSIRANMVAVVFQALPEPSETPAAATPGVTVPVAPAVAPAR